MNIVKVSDHVGSSQVQLQVLMENTVFSFTLFLTNHADKKGWGDKLLTCTFAPNFAEIFM